MRVAAYNPELPADKTVVSTTAFMTAAADKRPARSNTSVKGLTLMSVSSFLSSRGSVYGMMRLITRMERI